MQYDADKILDLLVSEHYLEEEDAERAKRSEEAGRDSALDLLMAEGLLSYDLIGQAVAEASGVPYADLNSHMPSREMVQTIPAKTGMKYRAVFFNDEGKQVVVATDQVEQSGLKSALTKLFKGKKVVIAYALTRDIDEALLMYRGKFEDRFGELLSVENVSAPDVVDAIFDEAVVLRASDIHFEPQEADVLLRFRVDGILRFMGRIGKKPYERMLNRIKVLARLRTDEHAQPQDGSIRHKLETGTNVDIRVSIVPIFDGEKIVLRLLTQYTRDLSLGTLGMGDESQKQFSEASHKPFGMIIVTGPTGSGKTTTLYSLIKRLNKPEVNIATVEDPVEYRVQGVNHIQINEEQGLTFARGLRSIVRQDPDIILVGEIRDHETAEISVNAALTGHLLLSTFHANDAATAIPRLLDMEIEPFLLSSTLELVVAQRLVRTLCSSCRYSHTEKNAALKKAYPQTSGFLKGTSTTLYKAKGCSICHHTGYVGRTAVFEMIPGTPAIRELILRQPSTAEIWAVAQKEGARSMYEDGMQKVLAGITTMEELNRVVPPPSVVYAQTKQKTTTRKRS